jgi:sigma-B regulation protein RsbU (phosphoserine phosphatase)
MARNSSLSTRLVLVILLPLTAVLVGSTLLETHLARRSMLGLAETAAQNLADSVVEELQGVLRSTRAAVDGLAIPLAHQTVPQTAEVDVLLRESLNNFPLIFGSTLALVPETAEGHAPFAPFVFRSGENIVSSSLAGEDYRYWEQPWFTQPLATGGPVWTAPYLDEGGSGIRMVTYARPLTMGGRKAVLTADIDLSFLSQIAKSNLLGQASAVIVFDAAGRLVAHPLQGWILNLSLGDLADFQSVPALSSVAGAVARGENIWLRPQDGMNAGIISSQSDLPGRLFARPLNEAGWGVAVYFSDQDFLATIQQATRYKLFFSVLFLILLASILTLVSRRSLRPLGELAQRTRSIARGDFSADTPGQERKDEIGRLSRAFRLMQEHLQQHIDDLTRATAERERMEGELAAARQIQQMLLPSERPSKSALNLRLVARLQPARAVGGDLYYYKILPDQRLLFAIGDVSDKGVPAALFMARVMAVLEAAAQQSLPPAEVLSAVNQSLAEENDLCMFVTLLVGEVSLEDGQCRLASAGHEHPIKVNRTCTGPVDVVTGPPLGLDIDNEYGESLIMLEPGDSLFVYTDGVTEARDQEGMFFGDERLMRCLTDSGHDTPAAIMEQTVYTVERFVGEAEQADDITLLVLQWQPALQPKTDSLTGVIEYSVKAGCHIAVTSELQKLVSSSSSPVCDPADLTLVIEEVLTNVVKYSGLDENHFARVRWYLRPDSLKLRFEDSGKAFEPLAAGNSSTEEREFSDGGMGIMLVQALVDTFHYTRLKDANWLELSMSPPDSDAQTPDESNQVG